MRCLGIFVFYDKNGIVSEYVEYLLAGLKYIVDDQIVVVNGTLQPSSKERLLKSADKIFVRENNGFDAGAYKDIFLNYLTQTELQKYDEIVLCNDSFYGPIFPFEEVWNKVEKEQPDFWGLTRHPGGTWGNGELFPTHIQSYFLVLGRQLFLSCTFHKFWEKVSYWTDFLDVIKGFEVKFTEYFERQGFKGLAVTDLSEYGKSVLQPNENPYVRYSHELICRNICPVWKRKSLMFGRGNLDNILRTYQYVCENTSYPGYLIKDHIQRLIGEGNWCAGWNFNKLKEFYMRCEKVYIFGAGKWGRDMQAYFRYHKWSVAGILISDGERAVGSEQVFQEGILKDTDGLVVALGRKNLDAVVGKLRETLKAHQLFIPDYR